MNVKIAKGSNALEQKAIDAKLRELGLEVDPETRQVSEVDISRSKVKGGLATLAAQLGDRIELGLDDLHSVQTKFGLGKIGQGIAGIVGADQVSVAHATIQSAVLTMEGTGAQLEKFLNAPSYSYDSIISMLGRISHLKTVFEAVGRPEVISHASRAEVNQLRKAFASLLATFSRYESTLAGALKGKILDQINRDNAYNTYLWNFVASRGGAVLDAEYAVAQQGVSPSKIRTAFALVLEYPSAVRALISNRALFG